MTFNVRQTICPTYSVCLMSPSLSLSLQVMKAVTDQYRLPAPHNCPPALHSLMLQCWQADRGDRLAFDSLLSSLDRLIRHPASLKAEPTRWASRKHNQRQQVMNNLLYLWILMLSFLSLLPLQKLLSAAAQPHPHRLISSGNSLWLAEGAEDGEIPGWVWSGTPGHVRQSQHAHHGVSIDGF